MRKISVFLIFLLALVIPFLITELILGSLSKLHLSPTLALVLLIAILFGGLINIPLKVIERDTNVIVDPFAVYGLGGFWPQLRRVRRSTILAVNVGGCVIPTALALYEIYYLAAFGGSLLAVTALGCAVNVLVCYLVARPVPNVGILMPGLIPPVVAASFALLFASEQAAPVAFTIGVMGPLIGADLLHLKDIEESSNTGVISIGGAGTFDGIVLSGVIAAYLA
jgi:uncharacterized membrane protein